MANNTLDKAIAAIPNFGKRIKLFTEKLRIAQYADNSIYDYRNCSVKSVIADSKKLCTFAARPIAHYFSSSV